MDNTANRLYFIDAIRAWAIIMMLQGHFIDGLLDPFFRDDGNVLFSIWKYFRGITAPVFFTVSGFIFTYLLVRSPEKGRNNPRVAKGLKRGLELLAIGYLLRTNLFGLLQGIIYPSFFLVDVLHCIGMAILGIIGLYLLTASFKKWVFPSVLLACTLTLFVLEPLYAKADLHLLPQWAANYFTKANGSVFTIFPWFGYASFGAFAAWLFYRNKSHRMLYQVSVPIFLIVGATLLFGSSPLFVKLFEITGIRLFEAISLNNYLFIRLGDVLIVFALFMIARKYLARPVVLRIGQNTLSIYVIHFIILYGSFTGLGLYSFFHHGLTPWATVFGALVFVTACCYLALLYETHKNALKYGAIVLLKWSWEQTERTVLLVSERLRSLFWDALKLFGMVKN